MRLRCNRCGKEKKHLNEYVVTLETNEGKFSFKKFTNDDIMEF